MLFPRRLELLPLKRLRGREEGKIWQFKIHKTEVIRPDYYTNDRIVPEKSTKNLRDLDQKITSLSAAADSWY